MTRWAFGTFGRSHRGATAVEFALVVGPMLLVLLGIAEFGRFFWTAQSLQRVATRAARCVGLLQSDCASAGAYSASSTISYVQAQALTYGVTVTSAMVVPNAANTCAGVAGFATVQINYTFATLVPAFIPALAAGVPVTAKACFPNQGS
jgi:Flp pilus assembly protein TadG